MRTNFTLPSGSKARTQSTRRYVVFVEYVVGSPAVEYRTDNIHRAIDRAGRIGKAATVVDTYEGKSRIPSVWHPATNTRTPEQWVEA